MAENPETNPTQTETNQRKLVINVPAALLSTLRTTCAAKADVSLLGRIQGKHPGLKALTAWARDTLHPSFVFLSLKTNNLFEVTFSNPEGRIHALTQTELTCDSTAISFSSWRPHFDPKTTHSDDQLDYPVWVQIVDLCQILRDESFLRTIGAQMGQVITIDNSDAYRAKLFGPRIRLLVQSLNTLPQTIVLPRLDREGTVEYKLEYSGLPNQCGRCRSREHQVRYCPKREIKLQQRPKIPNTTPTQRGRERTELPSIRRETTHKESVEQEPVQETPELEIAQETSTPATPPADPGNVQEKQQEASSTPLIHPVNSTQPSEQEPATPAPTDSMPEQESQQVVNTPPAPPANSFQPTQSGAEETTIQDPELQPNDINFPMLPSPKPKTPPHKPSTPNPPEPIDLTPQFIWRPKATSETTKQNKGKEKMQQQGPDTAPLTRQGYRSGRLAEDFWTALGMPNIPPSPRKKLRVVPFITKNEDQVEYLVNENNTCLMNITEVNIAELLAGIPWTTNRAQQHVVNEIAQALHKVLMFNNTRTSPFQKWSQGKWFASWTSNRDWEHTCTLYVCIAVPEAKVKVRKGRDLGWRRIPGFIKELISAPQPASIQATTTHGTQWQEMAGTQEVRSYAPDQHPTPISPNRFEVLREDNSSS